MNTKKWGIAFIVLIVSIVVVVTSIIFIVRACNKKPEEEIPWYEDYENIELVLEEERLEGKQVIIKRRIDYSEKIELTFTINKSNEDDKEYMPKMKLLYKGEEKPVVFRIQRRYIPFDGKEYNYNESIGILGITRLGYHYVDIEGYLNQKDRDDLSNVIYSEEFYLKVVWEE